MGDLKCDNRSVTGAIASFLLAIVAMVPFLSILFWGNIVGVVGGLTADLILLAEFAGVIIVSVLAFSMVGGFAGENNAKAGGALGVVGGMVGFGGYLTYLLYSGAATVSFPTDYTNPLNILFMGLVILGTLVGAGAIYKTAGYAFD